MQDESEPSEAPLIFVYYRMRGQMQPLRNLCCYMGRPFVEVHLDRLQSQRKSLSPSVLKQLSRFKIDRSQLPALIHGDNFLQGQSCIAPYLCMAFKHRELFGSSIFIRARVQEIMGLYYARQPESMIKMMELIDLVGMPNINHLAAEAFDRGFTESRYLREICQLIDLQPQPTFVFGQLTLIDFFFLESSIYLTGFYSNPERLDREALERWRQNPSLPKPNAYYMGVVAAYKQTMESQPWFQDHRDFLESFSIVCSILSDQRVRGLRKLWIGNPRMVAD